MKPNSIFIMINKLSRMNLVSTISIMIILIAANPALSMPSLNFVSTIIYNRSSDYIQNARLVCMTASGKFNHFGRCSSREKMPKWICASPNGKFLHYGKCSRIETLPKPACSTRNGKFIHWGHCSRIEKLDKCVGPSGKVIHYGPCK